MSKTDIEKMVRRYRNYSSFWMAVFMVVCIVIDTQIQLTGLADIQEQNIKFHTHVEGFIWGAVIVGFATLLYAVFYSLEKMLVMLFAQE